MRNLADGGSIVNTWAALAEIQHARLRCYTYNSGRVSASISLHTWNGGNPASFTAKLRKGETLEAMVCRAIVELHRRERDGMPRTRPAAIMWRRNRKLLESADRGRPM